MLVAEQGSTKGKHREGAETEGRSIDKAGHVRRHITRGVALPSLREWRQRRLLTQVELAERAGVAAGTVTRAERGELVSYANVRKFAGILQVTPEQLQNEAPE
jgi:DNA-binding XRE family transcriptional regulator